MINMAPPPFSSWLLVLSTFFSTAVSELLVELPNGKIEGYVRQSPNNVTFHVFQGIPYAKPPLGKLRFKPPVPVDNWKGVLETKKDGSRCYSQAKDTLDESENCLFINVFTPVLKVKNAKSLPVMVYFYGGGFRDGASKYTTYGPDYLVEQGVVVVTMNYRVGPFGFLSTGDDIVPGNNGLKDQAFALKWVQKNIELFGGDKKKVTIFGHSAGGASVGLHVVSKLSAGMFRAAIAQSGSAISNWAYVADPKPYGYLLASKINASKTFDTTADLFEFLQSVPSKEIDIASSLIDHPLPVLETENDGAFLTKSMFSLLENGDFNRVPLMIGSASEEYISLASDMDSLHKRAEGYDHDLTKLVLPGMNIENKTEELIVGKKIKEIYLRPDAKFQDNLGLAIAYRSESHFMNSCVRHAQLQSKYTDVYFYKFSYAGKLGKNTNVTVPGAEKCTHGEEVHYLFKQKSNGYDNSDLRNFPKADVLTQRRMLKIWTNFAKYMTPTPVKDPLLENLLWPKMETERTIFVDIDNELTIQNEIKEGRYRKWRQLFEEFAVPPTVVF